MIYNRIGIIAAMEKEVRLLKEALLNSKEHHVYGQTFYTGNIGDNDVVVMKCGVGKVSAALGAQVMISEFKPDVIINTGCAGALNGDLNVGDVVLSTKAVEWDIDSMALGDPRGYISSLGLVEIKAFDEITDLIIEHIPSSIKTVKGLIASGDVFIDNDEKRKVILDAFPEAMCAEMEGAAIGHACYTNNVPFTILRCMSDTADGNSGVDYPSFAVKASELSASIMIDLLKEI